MANLNTRLSESLPVDAAHELPSSMTESLLAEALASDDINTVKAHLNHAWAHYQSLEFALNSVADNVESIRAGLAATKARGLEIDIDDVEVAARYYAQVIVRTAYDLAHQVGVFGPDATLTTPDRLRLIYPALDHGEKTQQNPFETLSDEEIDEFLNDLLNGDSDNGDIARPRD